MMAWVKTSFRYHVNQGYISKLDKKYSKLFKYTFKNIQQKKELSLTSAIPYKCDASHAMEDKLSLISDPKVVNWLQNYLLGANHVT